MADVAAEEPIGGAGRRPFRAPPGEPPVLVDPRRWGASIGVAGGLVFVLAYAPALGPAVHVVAAVVAVVLALLVLVGLYVRAASLGPLREPGRTALAVYGACVVGELVLIAVGSRLLDHLGHAELRPALIAAVVGLHFLPFAWAFGEPHFLPLGTALLVLGVLGLAVGAAGVSRAADAAAVLAGLVMLGLLVRYARGRTVRTTT